MNPWPQDRLSWYQRLRRLWLEAVWHVRHSRAAARAALRQSLRAVVRACNLSWVRRLPHQARMALIGAGRALGAWIASVRHLPAVARVALRQASSAAGFVRAHRTLRRLALGLPALAA